MKRSAGVFAAGLVGLVGAAVAVFTSYSLAQSRGNGAVSATYVHGVLHVTVPFSAPRNGEGELTIEVRDPEDRVIAGETTAAYVREGHGLPPRDLRISTSLPLDDLIWHRLRYRFVYNREQIPAIEGIASISQVLRRPVVHVAGQKSYLSGSAAAVRLIVTRSDDQIPVTTGSLRIDLQAPGRAPRTLYTGDLNEHGTTRVDFRFPRGLAGAFPLHYVIDTPIGEADFTQQVRLEEKAQILLTTEKPVYQPGQTIHARALALDRASHQATGGRGLTFEVEDSRGNKVFRRITQTDEYGVASAEFALADEVNLGTYHLRATMDSDAGAASNKAELALDVERYVLPRFKVDLDLAGKAAKAKRGYRPGDHVTGTARSTYFFGKPVDHADVIVKVTGRDVEAFSAGEMKGTTDDQGEFRFDIRLPGFFAGHPLNQGAALVSIEATVKDNGGHSETHAEPVSVSESPLLITAIPVGGGFATGLPNELFIVASYPDGTPAQADIKVHSEFGDMAAKTDRGGVATVQVTGSGMSSRLTVDARDAEGNRTSMPVQIKSRAGSDQILLQPDQAIYRAGDRIRLQVRSTRDRGSAYIDLVKAGQTIATHDIDIAQGRAELSLAANPDMAGTVELHAYFFGRDGEAAGDRRLIFVQPADELRIETAVDAPVYKPGGEARIGFHVTNSRGEGVQAALGLQVVDQAVFALAEKQPGFAKVFFYLEQEMMKPRYEIHSLGLPETISRVTPPEADQRDRAADALFAAMEVARPNDAALDIGRDVPRVKFAAYAERYRKQLDAQVARSRTNGETVADAWGNKLRVDQIYDRAITIRSAGPDGKLFSGDDIVSTVADPRLFRLRLDGTADVVGIVTDRTGAVIAGASVDIRNSETALGATLKSTRAGNYMLAGVPPGTYVLTVHAPGFKLFVRTGLVVKSGETVRADATLEVGMMADTVTVSAEANLLKDEVGVVGRFQAARSSPAAPLALNARFEPRAAAKPDLAEPHVRSWFPESLYVAPEIITDRNGRATITIPIADNITTWRMAMLASTRQGALGSGTSSLKVFQDFFTEMDLPVTLTQGDEVSIPVAIYNYAGSRGNVRLRLENSDWFLLDGDTTEKRVSVETEHVGAAQFSIAAKRIGKFKLTLRADMEGPSRRADIVVREIEVVPNGREQSMVFNGHLDSEVRHTVDFPPSAIPESGTIFVRLYPGPLSQVVEGMDSLLRMPFGCFEQTSSSTYPNVLALDYMKRTKKLTPEVHAKAEGFITTGYQRLLTFEVPGGGFSWFGNAPANKILTSYGLMEFSDMSKVHEIDERVIQRTQRWLASQQQPDGSWRPDQSFINEGATNRYNSNALRITAYIAWALEASGYQGPAVERARHFIEKQMENRVKPDAYTLAVLANFAVDYAKDRQFAAEAIRLVLDAKTEQGDQVWWKSEETSMYAIGASAAVETTGLAVQALLKDGSNPAVVTKAMNYITAKKDSAGTWGTTQATIMALRALLLASEKSGSSARGDAEVLVNGKVSGHVALTAANNDLLHQFVFKDIDARAANNVEIRFHGEGSMAYQLAGRYFVPWNAKSARDPLSIDVTYDRTRLSQDQIATATATVRNNLKTTGNMVMVDLGIPPGFELLSEDLQDYRDKSVGQRSGRLEKFSLTATQAILYFDSIAPEDEFSLKFRLRAKYPVRARTFQSRVYEYYAPDVNAVAAPAMLEVRK